MPSQRYKLTLAYRGTRYYGWQFQTTSATWKDPPLPSGLAFPRRQPLNVGHMQPAAAPLGRTHHFASFAKPRHGRGSTTRTVFSCTVSNRGHRVVIGIEGSGFLWNMVRIIAGTLV